MTIGLKHTAFTRRLVLATGFWGSAAVAMNAKTKNFFGSDGRQIGVQLYPISAEVERDLPGTLGRLAAMGYRTVETSGFHGYSAAQLKAAAHRAGLTITSVHVQPQLRLSSTDHLMTGDLGPLVADLHEMGVQNVVMPMVLLPEELIRNPGADTMSRLIKTVNAFTVSDWRQTAAFLNRCGAELNREGIRLSYHNHNFEFARIPTASDRTGWDVLIDETDPATVGFEMDIGWVVAAGLDPVGLLKKCSGRVGMLHLKDVASSSQPNFALQQTSAPAGKGVVHWAKLLHVARLAGVTGYFVEQEPASKTDAMDEMAQSITFLKTVI